MPLLRELGTDAGSTRRTVRGLRKLISKKIRKVQGSTSSPSVARVKEEHVCILCARVSALVKRLVNVSQTDRRTDLALMQTAWNCGT